MLLTSRNVQFSGSSKSLDLIGWVSGDLLLAMTWSRYCSTATVTSHWSTLWPVSPLTTPPEATLRSCWCLRQEPRQDCCHRDPTILLTKAETIIALEILEYFSRNFPLSSFNLIGPWKTDSCISSREDLKYFCWLWNIFHWTLMVWCLGFHDWSLTSVETWGEGGHGSWHLYIVNRAGHDVQWTVGECHLQLHGTKTGIR